MLVLAATGPLPHSAFNSLHRGTKVAEDPVGEGEGTAGGRKPLAFNCPNKEAAAQEGRQGGPENGAQGAWVLLRTLTASPLPPVLTCA